MWIVYLALRRPYTFVVSAILVIILGLYAIVKMPTDIFPNVNIPVISVIWQYTGMPANEIEKRIVGQYERILTTTVNDIEHIESQSLNGTGVIKIYFQQGAKIEQAIAQVTAVSQTALRQMPPGANPPLIIQFSASNVPIVQLSLSSNTLAEQSMFDIAINQIRPQLITVPGIQVPYPYGGKQRQIVVDLDPDRLAAYGISPADVSQAINNQNVILPAGSAKIGSQEYPVLTNSSPTKVGDLNDLPIKNTSNPDGTKSVVYVRDVASVRDGFQVQTNVVHTDGKRGVLISIYKNGGASTLDVVKGVLDKLPAIQAGLPPASQDLKITPLFDQSVFVRASVEAVIHEAAIAAGLTALMILLFLGSWRSTLIVIVSIPLSILVSIIILALMGETLNTMTLGGMALAVGILVDDATVAIENIHRNLHQRKTLVQAIIDGSAQIAVPAFVATICICIVFVPVVFITGAAKYLFTPLAMAVVFAMLTSYVLSRTLVPTMAHFLLASEVEMYGGRVDENDPHHGGSGRPARPLYQRKGLILLVVVALFSLGSAASYAVQHGQAAAALSWIKSHPKEAGFYACIAALALFAIVVSAMYQMIWRVHALFNMGFQAIRHLYGRTLAFALIHRTFTIFLFLAVIGVSIPLLWSNLGRDFFPNVDAGLIRLHVRAPAGTRIEETERHFAAVQEIIRDVIPAEEVEVALDNIGIPNSGINLSLSDGTVNSPSDGEVLIALRKDHKPTEDYIKKIRAEVGKRLPHLTTWAAPADISTQVLNFGLPASIDVQIAGSPLNLQKNRELLLSMYEELVSIPGIVDPRLQQVTQTPNLQINVDRTLSQQLGVTQRDVASDLLISLSSSSQTAPNFWLNPENGVTYSILVQTPQYRMGTLQDLARTPVVPSAADGVQADTQLLGNLADVTRSVSPTNITRYNIQPTVDLLLGVQGTDLASVSKQIDKIIKKYEPQLPKGSKFAIRGQIESMNSSFKGLAVGLIFAVILVYLLMVINFQSWVDPMIILMAVPGAAAGILWMLWATQTTISVPALMGAMMTVGVATANSILMITFANDQRRDLGMSAVQAALSAGMTRLRPVVMTAAAMVIGMLPMAIGAGEGGEQNSPLGRAVIGGLLMATMYTLIFVPVVYSVVRRKAPVVSAIKELQIHDK